MNLEESDPTNQSIGLLLERQSCRGHTLGNSSADQFSLGLFCETFGDSTIPWVTRKFGEVTGRMGNFRISCRSRARQLPTVPPKSE
jgi:hypothetical protein